MATTPDFTEILREVICELAADICCLSRCHGPTFRARVKDISRRARLIALAADVLEDAFKREYERECELARGE